jgi:hypothetical protein
MTIRTNTAIVRPLGSGETALGPAVGSPVNVKERILLLETKPRVVVLGKVHNLLGVMTEVGAVGRAVIVIRLGKDEDVLAAAEGVLENGCGAQVDVRIVAWGLVGRRAVKVPDAEVVDALDFLGNGLRGMLARVGRDSTYTHHGLGAEATVAIDPDV